MLTKNYNDKQVAALCLTNIITNLDVLAELDCVNVTEYQAAIVVLIRDGVSRLAGAITLSEESGVGSEILRYSKAIIEACSTANNEQLALQKLAKQAVQDFHVSVWKDETKWHEKAEKDSKSEK